MAGIAALTDPATSVGRPWRPWTILAVFVVTAAALAVAYAAFIRLVDPRRHFGTGRYPAVIGDGRSEKLPLFRAFAASGPVDGIVLGSSRSMNLAPGGATSRFFNFAVSSARAEDHLAISRWARAQATGIRTVVIGLDVEALHETEPMPTSLEFSRELRAMLEGVPGPMAGALRTLRQYKRAFGASHLFDAVTALVVAAGVIEPEGEIWFEPDGRARYPIKERQRAEGTYDLTGLIEACRTGYVTRLGGMSALSAARRAALETTVREWRARRATVKIVIMPLHERAAPYVAARTRYLALIEEIRLLLDELGRDPGVEAYDYSRAEAFGGRAAEWYDCYHLDEAGAARLTRMLMGAGS